MEGDILSPTALKWIFTGCLVIGVGFYVTWGAAFNAFFDYANYTVSVILILTGLFGMVLYRELEKEQAKAQGAK